MAPAVSPGRDGLGTRVWLGLALWAVALAGEARVLSQSALALVLWTALFALPPAYVASRAALDALVDEAVLFVGEVLRGGEVLGPCVWPGCVYAVSYV